MLSSCPTVSGSAGTWEALNNAGPGNLGIRIQRAAGTDPTSVSIFASPQYPVTVTNPRKRFRRVVQLTNQVANFSSDLAPFYEPLFGSISNGKQIFIRAEFFVQGSPQANGSSEFVFTTTGF